MSGSLALAVDSQALRRARLSAAMTQLDLARAAGVNRTTIVRLESGRPATPSSVRRIAGALGVDICTFATVVEVVAS